MTTRARMAACWSGEALGAVFVTVLVGACGQSTLEQDVPSAGPSVAGAAVALAESPVTAQQIAGLRRRFVIVPTARPDVPHGAEPAREQDPRAVIEAGVATGFERWEERARAVIPADAKRRVPRTASVELPAVANGAARLADDTSRVAITFALEGATEAPITVADGIVRYPGALGGADVVHRVHAEGTEDFVVFEARPAREELRYTVDVSHVAGLRLVSNTLELLDEAGSPRLRVAPPYVVDAGGERHEASLSIDGCAYSTDPRGPWGRPVTRPGATSCEVRVSWSEVTYPALVDPSWTATGSMAKARQHHTATLLGSGKVLFAGGDDGNGIVTASAELYDPASGTFAAAGPMAAQRENHGAIALPFGKVLIVGGQGAGSYLSSAELYDPSGAGTFSAVGPLAIPRSEFTVTVLGSGQIVLVGGKNAGGFLASAELYTPGVPGMLVGPMSTPRARHTATLLPSGKVLIAGGSNGVALATAELFDAPTGLFTLTGSMPAPREFHTATLLGSGKVLIAGGSDAAALASALLYDAPAGAFSPAASMTTSRADHTATLLGSGSVLLAGGTSGGGSLASAELYDPTSDTFAAAASLITARDSHSATLLLLSGKVLAAGGPGLTSAELYDSGILTLPDGAAGCSIGGQCQSGVCNDGVCCSGPCSGSCTTCAVVTGECIGVAGTDDLDTCAGTHTCDSTGACKLVLGQPCAGANDCESVSCADGVCCNTACDGACEACDVAPNLGTCSPIAGAPHPGHGYCGGSDPCSGTCDGTNPACAYPGATTLCSPTCSGAMEMANVCGGNGVCYGGKATPCVGGLTCGPGGRCLKACTGDGDCVPGLICTAGACAPVNGASCASDHLVANADGTMIDCAPFTCAGGVCKTSCSSSNECVSPDLCEADGRCVPPSAKKADTSSGCAVRFVGDDEGGAGALVIAIGLAAMARRRRAAR